MGEVGNIINIFDKGIAGLNSPRTLFTQDHDLDPVELARGEAT